MAEAPRPRKFIGRRAAEAAAAANGGTVTSGRGDEVVAARPPATKRFVKQQVPDDILHDEALNEAIAVLPPNYNFEIHKTVARIRQLGAHRVALQFPEGLLMYACVIADILESHAGVQHAFVMGDVTYGACCVDDFSALALRADLLVHYGHSCLVPVDVTKVPCMYVFVDIGMDVRHLVGTVCANFPAGTHIALAGTIQFGSSIQAARQELVGDYPSLRVPQARPLSPGEVLGCTAPVMPPDTDAIIFVADGRFHLEAIMIANPAVPAFRYDPYAREMTAEQYDQAGMRAARRKAVEAAAPARQWGIVLGTLGRQGNPRIVRHLQSALAGHGRCHITVLLSEVLPSKLAMFRGIDAWVQVACPRLSIDWGEAFTTPTLTPYEALIALGEVRPWWESGSQQTDKSHGQPAAQPAQQAAAAPPDTSAMSQPHQQQPQRPSPATASATPASPPDAGSRGDAAPLRRTAADTAAAGRQLAGMSISDRQAAKRQTTEAQKPSHAQLPAEAQRLAHSQQMADAVQAAAAGHPIVGGQPADVQEPVRDALHRPPAVGAASPPPHQPQPCGTTMAVASAGSATAAEEAQQSGARADGAITAASTPAASSAAAGAFESPRPAAATAAGPEPQRPAKDAATQPATSATPAVMRQPTSPAAVTGPAASEARPSVSGAAAEMPEPPAASAAARSELAACATSQDLQRSPAPAAAADSQLAAGATAEERRRRRDRRQAFDAYPMDYYAKDGGPWGSYYAPRPSGSAAAKLAAMRAARA